MLLSTFNGARYLPALLESLQAQTAHDWRLLVRDDGSSDDTLAVLEAAAGGDGRIELWHGAAGRLGVTGSFAALMAEALRRGAAYFALCDQDDVWLPEKLARLRTAIGSVTDAQRPTLAYSDLRVVDEQLRVLSASFFAQSGAGRAWQAPSLWLLQHNLVPGCAMMGNRALLARCVPMPAAAVIHDWWIVLCAASMGAVVAVPEPLILYRQHGANTIGAMSFVQKFGRLWRDVAGVCREKQRLFLAALRQAAALADRLSAGAPQEARWLEQAQAMVQQFSHPERAVRLRGFFAGPVRRVGLARNILLLCVLWRAPCRHEPDGMSRLK